VPEIEFDPVDTIAAGAVGEPGSRAFYIQAEKDGQVLSVLVEKQQVAMLAERVRILLDQVETQFPGEGQDIPVPLTPDAGELRGDPVPLFRALAIGIGFDPSRRLVVLELHERPIAGDDDDEDEDDEDSGADLPETGLPDAGLPEAAFAEALEPEDEGEGYLARLYFTAAQARAMATRGSAAVESGRPPCPLCGGPLDPSGHVCPRLNGHGQHDGS
jgi:uncharacterized repeat protein (TIGR03847 family)